MSIHQLATDPEREKTLASAWNEGRLIKACKIKRADFIHKKIEVTGCYYQYLVGEFSCSRNLVPEVSYSIRIYVTKLFNKKFLMYSFQYGYFILYTNRLVEGETSRHDLDTPLNSTFHAPKYDPPRVHAHRGTEVCFSIHFTKFLPAPIRRFTGLKSEPKLNSYRIIQIDNMAYNK